MNCRKNHNKNKLYNLHVIILIIYLDYNNIILSLFLNSEILFVGHTKKIANFELEKKISKPDVDLF